MQFKRSERVSELLRHEISKLVLEIQDPNLGFVTITAVRVSDDLIEAKVYFSVYGSAEEIERSSEILKRKVGFMRHLLGRKLESLRRVPALHFILDDTPVKAQRVTEILKKIEEEQNPGFRLPRFHRGQVSPE